MAIQGKKINLKVVKKGLRGDNLKKEEIRVSAIEKFERAWQTEKTQRAEELSDLKFRAGEQWPETVRKQRESEDRPVITINLMGRFIRQVTGDIRINKPSIKVRPSTGAASREIAKIFTGAIRHIEEISDAQNAYITAADGSATCGIGHFRIVTEYSDDDSFEQDIRIERVLNPFSVYWDPAAERLNRSDAKWAFVTKRIQLEDYKMEYPGADTSNFDASPESLDDTQWWDGETVRVAEYWLKEPVTKEIGQMETGEVVQLSGISKEDLAKLTIVRKRTVKSHKIVRYVMSGSQVLEGPGDWAGKHIPIIPVIGEEIFVGDRVVRHGLVRFAKDAQMLYNYSRTMMAEASALAPKAPWILTPAQLEGHKAQWESANRGNPPYLLYNPDPLPNVGPPVRVAPAQVSTAQLQETIISSQDMKSVTGIEDANLGARGNETSGRAIALRQQEGDVGSFVYTDNLSKSIKWAGEILVDLIPHIYDTERLLRILGEDGKEDFIPINVEVTNDEGEVELIHDLSVGKYDVKVITGPSYSTKRMEASDSMMAFVEAVPGAAAVISDLIAENMDWPGAEEIAARLRKTLPPGLADTDEKDMTPEQLATKKAATEAAEAEEAQAKELMLTKAVTEIEKLAAEVVKIQADAEEKKASADMKDVDTAQKALQMSFENGEMNAAIKELVTQEVMKALST